MSLAGKGRVFSLEHRKKISEFRKNFTGWKHSPETIEKMRKSNPHYWLGKKNLKISNENHYLWKGEKASYISTHVWVRRRLGNAKICTKCGSTNWVEWANIDHLYKRDLADYIALCRSCHHIYDNKRKADNKKTSLSY